VYSPISHHTPVAASTSVSEGAWSPRRASSTIASPQLGEADPVGVQDVGQRRALLGPAAAGLAGRRPVGGPVGGELGDHRLEVAGDRVSQVLEAHHLPVTVELNLGQQPLDDPVDQLGKPGPDRPGDLGDLGGQDDARDARASPRGRAIHPGSSVSQGAGPDQTRAS
jgi:hypothetical protein